MNALTNRRRYLKYHLWVRDICIGFGFIITIITVMYGLDHLAQYCQTLEICQ